MRLRYTRHALDDLEDILDYIAGQSPQGVRKIHARIKAMTELLLSYPHIGARTPDPVIRRMTTPPYPYLIFYEASDDIIIIHAVRHSARNPPELHMPRAI